MKRLTASAVAVLGLLLCGGAVVVAATAANDPALPRGGTIIAKIPIPHTARETYGGFAVGEGSVWALSDEVSTLSRIDPEHNTVVARIKIQPKNLCPAYVCGEPAAGAGAVWVPRASDNTVTRVDPASNAVTTVIPVGAHPTAAAVTPGAVWIVNSGGARNGQIEGPTLSRIDPATNEVVKTIVLAPVRYASDGAFVTAGAGAVWVSTSALRAVLRIDPKTNAVTAKFPVPVMPCGQLAADARAVWTSTGIECRPIGVARIDTHGRHAQFVKGEIGPVGLALGFGSLWVADLERKTVDRIDPRAGRIVGRLPIEGIPVRLGIGFGSVWVRDDTGRVLRIKPAR
jgi:YVTN family beta-propeller protein